MNIGFVHVILALLLSWSTINTAQADQFQPLFIHISQAVAGSDNNTVYRVEARVPNDPRLSNLPTIALSNDCTQINSSANLQSDNTIKVVFVYQCTQAIGGANVLISYNPANPGLSTLLTVDVGENNIVNAALPPHQDSWQIPERADNSSVAVQYFALGLKHLLTGFDHLLFVACLLFICFGRWGKLVATITAFTLAHSLTLALNVFGLLALNTRAVEAVIALSIVYLAYDIIRHSNLSANSRLAGRSLSYQHPALVAAGFGLLHGLGFANIINQYGLPPEAKIWALLSFNIGIEIGQLAFVALLLLVSWLGVRILAFTDAIISFDRVTSIGAYFVGITAMFWTWQRVLGVF